MMKQYLRLSLFVLLIFVFCGCTTDAAPRQENSRQITLSEIENHLGGDDPCEGFNRSMFAVTSFLMDYVARPVGTVYSSIFPRPFITHLHNVCVNLAFPSRAISCLARAHWKGAGHETARFLLNSTIGIAGIFDPAEYFFHIHSTESDFGQTFAVWGIAPGETFILPLSPALNPRDIAGMFFDSVFDLKTYIPYAGTITSLNNMTLAHDAFKQLVSDSNDRYKTYRELATLHREMQLRMWRYNALNTRDELVKQGKLPRPLDPSPEVVKPQWLQGKWLILEDFGPGTPVLDSLRTLLFKAQNDNCYWYMPQSVFNTAFSSRRQDRNLSLAPDRPDLTYAFWPMPAQEKDSQGKAVPRKEKLAILLPGIGGTAASGTPTAYAELLNRNGYAVLTLDSTFTWQFVVSRSGCRLPGFLPSDARAVQKIIRLAIDDLKKAELVTNPEIVLTGYSFGGMHTLKIAELENERPLIGIRKYLAVNPPVSLEHAILQADALARSMDKYTPQEALDKAFDSAGALLAVMKMTPKPFDKNMSDRQKSVYRIQTEPEIAGFLAGLYFRSSMRSMLFSAHKERGLIPLPDMPVEFKRNKLYKKLDTISFREYAEKYLLSEYPGVKLDTLYRKSNLRSLEKTLKTDDRVHILHSINDFLLTEDDRKFLDSVLGSRITWTSRGGHLGNLYYRSVQNKIIDLLK